MKDGSHLHDAFLKGTPILARGIVRTIHRRRSEGFELKGVDLRRGERRAFVIETLIPFQGESWLLCVWLKPLIKVGVCIRGKEMF